MIETKFALHIHTYYSDGNASHQELVKIAAAVGLDGLITTDHNILVRGVEGYYGDRKNKTMLLIGEEIHDRSLDPPGNHMMVFGVDKEMSPFSAHPQRLIDQVNRLNGLSFIAHPVEDALEMFGEKAYSWQNWDVKNFTGIELWNHMSEFKSVTKGFFSALTNAFFPKRMTHGPLEQTLSLWDDLIKTQKKPVVAIGGVDAHQIIKRYGPITIKLYPYLHHFKSITTHILTPRKLNGLFEDDKLMILNAMQMGHCFVAYDLPARTDGFRFTVNNDDGTFIMGDKVKIKGGLTFQIRLPRKTPCRLFKDGQIIKEWTERDICTHMTKEPGVYRVEAFIPYKGKLRGWIFSNPIYAWG